MTAYYQIFLDHGGNVIPAVRALCQGMDEQESALEKIRIRLGFHEDWSPSYDRQQAAPPRADVSWAAKAGMMNGMGDMGRLVGEMCSGMDIISEKWAEVNAVVFASGNRANDGGVKLLACDFANAPSPKRGPGRPPNKRA